METFYFGYGANTNLDAMYYRCPNAINLGTATLSGYKFRFATHADVVEDPSFNTEGVLWDVTDECLKSLDEYEGCPHYYIRKECRVVFNNTPVTAWVYMMVDGIPSNLPDNRYLECLLEGYGENNIDTIQIEDALLFTKFEK